MKKNKQNIILTSPSDKDSFIKSFFSKLKRLQFSFIQIFFKEKEKPEPISSLAAKVLKSKKEIEKIQPYLNRLNSALSSENITNIAITGSYGSGKSTVIRTFQDIYKTKDPNNNFEYLNISLASFKDELIDEGDNDTSNEDKQEKDELNGKKSEGINKVSSPQIQENFERLLEVSILQQMIYHVKPSIIPDSRFKRIVNLTNTKLTVTALCFVIWIICTFSMFKFNVFSKINPITWTFSIKDIDYTSFLVIGIFLGGLTNIIFRLIRTFGNSRISKINIKGELELGENVDKSILNQHLDEIIYFFQRTKFNVLVIEDLDRFRDTEIFTKLREINLLLNNSDVVERKIVFIYAIRDDMFQGQERIKFFDYIIPIIPFINPSNANDKLTELIKEENLTNTFSQSFIDDVVTFIDDIDMRLLTNILQEYLVYKESLKHDLTQDNLLAIVIYKNIYPNDFAKLHKNKGDLYDFIANKTTYIKDLISNLDKVILSNNSLIASIENEKINEEKELIDVYLFNLLRKLNNPSEIYIKGEAITVDRLSELENFYALLEEQDINYNSFVINRSYNMFNKTKKSLGKSFSVIEKEINKHHTFHERVEFINKNKLEELKEQNELLEERKEDIKRWDIKEIFKTHEVNNYLEAFEDSILMRSLLINGYINENYLDYISLFHEVNITKGDYTFIRKVKSGVSLDFNYKIDKLENVIKKIDESHFEKVAILNHQIVEFILKNKYKNQPRYKSLKKLLKSEHKKVIDFIDSYKKDEHTNNGILFKELPNIWQGFWSFICSKSNKFSEKKTNEYFQLILTHATISDIKKLNNIESFKKHFSVLSNLGDLIKDKDHTGKIKSIIENFNTKFNDISELHYNSEVLYDLVLSNDYYEINTTNLLAITTDESISKNKFNSSNYTTIRNLDNEFTLAYIDKEIEIYVKSVLLALEENTSESLKSLILLLNNSNLTVMTRKLILESTLPVFQDLSEFDEIEIKQEILNQLAITPRWENVMDYFNSYEKENLDSILINYFNNKEVFKELTKSNLSSLKDDDETKKKLALAIIYCEDLDLESHKALRRCYHSSWSKLSAFEKLSYEKVQSMIESKFITLSVNHYDKTKENFSDLHIKFIERSFSTYIKAYDEYEMDEEDHSSILQSTILIDAQKKQFLDTLDENKILENTVVASSATKIYVNEKVSGLNYSLLHGLFKKSSSNEYRIKLFNLNVNSIDKDEVINLIKQLGAPYSRLTLARKQAKMSNNHMHQEFTNNLKRLGIITSNRENKGVIKAVASGNLA